MSLALLVGRCQQVLQAQRKLDLLECSLPCTSTYVRTAMQDRDNGCIRANGSANIIKVSRQGYLRKTAPQPVFVTRADHTATQAHNQATLTLYT